MAPIADDHEIQILHETRDSSRECRSIQQPKQCQDHRSWVYWLEVCSARHSIGSIDDPGG